MLKKVNGFLVRPKLSKLDILMAHTFFAEFHKLDQNHQIYVPHELVLGHFKERKDGFVLSDGNIFYNDSREDLQNYGKLFDEGKFEIVKPLSVPQPDLEAIAEQAKIYTAARQNIVEMVPKVDKYFEEK